MKVGYAPKEQYIRRGRQGPYTDVYSCAACLYAAITGYLPPESLERLDHDTLVPPSEAGAEIPLYLERAILKRPGSAAGGPFQTAGEFLEALESQKVVEFTGSDREETLQKQQVRSQEKRKKGRLGGSCLRNRAPGPGRGPVFGEPGSPAHGFGSGARAGRGGAGDKCSDTGKPCLPRRADG